MTEENYIYLKSNAEEAVRDYIEAAQSIGMSDADIKIELMEEILWEAGLKDFEL